MCRFVWEHSSEEGVEGVTMILVLHLFRIFLLAALPRTIKGKLRLIGSTQVTREP